MLAARSSRARGWTPDGQPSPPGGDRGRAARAGPGSGSAPRPVAPRAPRATTADPRRRVPRDGRPAPGRARHGRRHLGAHVRGPRVRRPCDRGGTAGRRGRPRRPGRGPDAVRHPRPVRRDPRRPRRRRRLRARRRRRPGRARRPRLRRGRRRGRAHRGRPGHRRPAAAGDPDARGRPGPGRRRLDHLHVRLDRHAQGRRGDATAARPPSSTPRRGCSCSERPLGPGDRVHGRAVGRVRRLVRGDVARVAARRVPGARAARRSSAAAWTSGRGSSANDVTVVSTVPTLVALWPAEALDAVRLLIFGGEACPPELAARLVVAGREVWNTYGPTEATVVACGARLDRRAARCASGCRSTAGTSRWSTTDGAPRRRRARSGELVIGGVGLARYLDPAKDAEKYAPMPTLGWERAYRSGDLVPLRPRPACSSTAAPTTRSSSAVGGSSSARSTRPCWRCPAWPVPRRRSGATGRGQPAPRRLPRARPGPQAAGSEDGTAFDVPAATARLRESLPAALVPRLAVVDTLPTRTSGKVDRDALPWPLAGTTAEPAVAAHLDGDRRVARRAVDARSSARASPGSTTTSSTSAAAASPRRSSCRGCGPATPRSPSPTSTSTPGSATLADTLDEFTPSASSTDRTVQPVPTGHARSPRPCSPCRSRAVVGLRWLLWLAVAANVVGALAGSAAWLPRTPWWAVAVAWLHPRLPARADAARRRQARLVLARGPARHIPARRSGPPADLARRAPGPPTSGRRRAARRAAGSSTTPGCSARASAEDVDLHTLPPVTGLLTLGKGCSVEPEVDLTGHWVDGDVLARRPRPGRRRRPRRLAQHARAGHPGRAGRARSPPARRCSARCPPESAGPAPPPSSTAPARHDVPTGRPPRGRRWVPRLRR